MDDETLFLPTRAGASERLRALQSDSILERARDLDRALSERVPSQTVVYWRATPTQASALGYRLATFDRECRRATRILTAPSAQLPRPERMSRAGFEVTDAGPGSLELVLLALGVTADVLLSRPVQLILTTRALIGDVRRVASWVGRQLPISSRPSLREIRATVESVLQEREDAALEAPVEIAWDDHGPVVRGAVDATVLRIYPDGSIDVVQFEGSGRRT